MRQFEFWSYEVFQSVYKTKVLKFPRHLSLSTLTTDHYSTLCYPYNRKFHQLVKVNDPRTRYWTSPPTSSRKYQSWLITSKQQRSWLKTHLHWTWCYYKRFVTVVLFASIRRAPQTICLTSWYDLLSPFNASMNKLTLSTLTWSVVTIFLYKSIILL